MGVYHITYAPQASEVCLYFDGKCNFSCRGCISKFYPWDCHLDEVLTQKRNKGLSRKSVPLYLKPLSFKKVIFLGSEPSADSDFLPLTGILKKEFSSYNILITNGFKYVRDKVIDEVCISIKAVSKDIFKNFTGRDNPEQVLKNFKKYADIPTLKLRAESIFIPGYIDKEEIEKIAQFIASIDPKIAYRIDAYIPTDRYSKTTDRFRAPDKREMSEAKIAAEKYLKNVSTLQYQVKTKFKVKRVY